MNWIIKQCFDEFQDSKVSCEGPKNNGDARKCVLLSHTRRHTHTGTDVAEI